ncbi:HAMP domain-containing histidine kinase [Halosquirtibacter xylanolyticus]|uniref:sensor histidine kinase n=1 Tax=Halosquirtibacter xylanolyticus TaxID=3374599 RepID=UPI00374A6538|nr:HAMP domain-containing histidine kinase [Prolixibacteraceae bacterium]
MVKKKRRLKEIEQRGNTFVEDITSVISHDIRTPISSLNSIIEFLEDESLSSDDRREILSRMKETTSGIEFLVHDILNWINLSKGEVKYSPQSVDLVDELESSIERFRAFIPLDKDIEILFNSKLDKLPVNVDMKMLRTVFRNITMNTFRYLPKQGVVHCNLKSIEEHVEIEICDNGCGMSPKQIELLMKKKKQASYIESLDQGVGIGLQICMSFMDIMKGELKVDSKQGIGTTFTIILDKNNGQ